VLGSLMLYVPFALRKGRASHSSFISDITPTGYRGMKIVYLHQRCISQGRLGRRSSTHAAYLSHVSHAGHESSVLSAYHGYLTTCRSHGVTVCVDMLCADTHCRTARTSESPQHRIKRATKGEVCTWSNNMLRVEVSTDADQDTHIRNPLNHRKEYVAASQPLQECQLWTTGNNACTRLRNGIRGAHTPMGMAGRTSSRVKHFQQRKQLKVSCCTTTYTSSGDFHSLPCFQVLLCL
jgi:hypothetical protein